MVSPSDKFTVGGCFKNNLPNMVYFKTNCKGGLLFMWVPPREACNATGNGGNDDAAIGSSGTGSESD